MHFASRCRLNRVGSMVCHPTRSRDALLADWASRQCYFGLNQRFFASCFETSNRDSAISYAPGASCLAIGINQRLSADNRER